MHGDLLVLVVTRTIENVFDLGCRQSIEVFASDTAHGNERNQCEPSQFPRHVSHPPPTAGSMSLFSLCAKLQLVRIRIIEHEETAAYRLPLLVSRVHKFLNQA